MKAKARRKDVDRKLLKWTCTHCDAKRGEQCRTPNGTTWRTGIHQARMHQDLQPDLPIPIPTRNPK